MFHHILELAENKCIKNMALVNSQELLVPTILILYDATYFPSINLLGRLRLAGNDSS
jgi:hypothetical protein